MKYLFVRISVFACIGQQNYKSPAERVDKPEQLLLH